MTELLIKALGILKEEKPDTAEDFLLVLKKGLTPAERQTLMDATLFDVLEGLTVGALLDVILED
jgi:hypothetical protein